MIQVIAFPKGSRGVDPAVGVYLTLDAPQIRVGRAPGCDVRLPDAGVRPYHATIRREGGSYALVVDGGVDIWVRPLDADRPGRLLGPGAHHLLVGTTLARFGPIEVLLNPHASGAVDPPEARRAFALEFLAQTLLLYGRYPYPLIYILRGPDHNRWVDLRFSPGAPRLVGRGRMANVMLRDKFTSRRHFAVLYGVDAPYDGGLWARDLGSSNGTFLGNDRLEPGAFVPWQAGRTLYAGRNAFVYQNPVADILEELERDDRGPVGGCHTLPQGEAGELPYLFAPERPSSDDEGESNAATGSPAGHDERFVESTTRPIAGRPLSDPETPDDE